MARILLAGEALRELKLVLEAHGATIIIPVDPQGAISVVLDDPPDMLIMDKGYGNGLDHDLLNAVKACLQKTNIPIILVVAEEELTGLDWQQYPVDDILVLPVSGKMLLTRVRLAQERMARVFDNNPLSRLPGNTSILHAIADTIAADESYGVCYVDIDNFKPYNDRYGFSQGDDVILMVARIIVNVIEGFARHESFVGHVGGDDFLFIVKEDMVEPICAKILHNFDAVKNMFLSPEDIKAGCYVEKDRQGRETTFGLLSLSIAVVLTGNHLFSHAAAVANVASQVKHYVKKLDGSNFMIDRRSGR